MAPQKIIGWAPTNAPGVRVGLISGSGADDWPGLPAPAAVETAYGPAQVAAGHVAGVEVVHVARHGAGHNARLSDQVDHPANVGALLDVGVNRAAPVRRLPTVLVNGVAPFAEPGRAPGRRVPRTADGLRDGRKQGGGLADAVRPRVPPVSPAGHLGGRCGGLSPAGW